MSASPESTLIATFEKNKKEEVRVSIDDFHGRLLINLRVFFKGDDGEWHPGKQGVAVSIDRYQALARAIADVGKHLQASGLLAPPKTP